ncbi:MAG TPA: hypothetical protein VLO11_13190 [Luteolibacter sp.]|nr:hypothetical protein [Luteolibacter sp.]
MADSDPLGLGRFVPTTADLLQETTGIESGIKGAFALNATLGAVYDSNFFLTSSNTDDEISVLFEPSLVYTSDPEGGATHTFSARYEPTFRAFLDNTDLNDIDHSGDILYTMRGSRTEVSLYANYAELTGTDRFTGAFTTGWVVGAGVRANREIASRTSINGGLFYSMSDYSSGGLEGSTVHGGYVGGLWRATGRTSMGATLRYTQSESDNSGTRDAWALLLEGRYRAGERIWLSATLGPEFSQDSDTGDNSVNLSANLKCRYVINERWSWVNSLRTDTVPSPSSTGYLVNNYGFSSLLEHSLTRGTVSGGIEFNYSEYDDVGNTLVTRDNEENYSLFLAYGRGFFNDRLSFDSSVRYRLNDGSTDWHQWLVSASVSMPF